MAQLAIVADDLTGAADTGAGFAGAGLATVIPLAAPSPPAADVLVLSTESRHLTADAAAARTRAAVRRVAGDAGSLPAWVYKKIDSVLRGQPREELLATMEALGATRVLVAPALPAEGRTTVGGRQYVAGVPLELSPFGQPGGTSDLVALLRAGSRVPVTRLDLSTLRAGPDAVDAVLCDPAPAIVVADAETEADLLTVARAAIACCIGLLCGSAGLARRLVAVLPLTPTVSRPSLPIPGGPILVVAGSQHEATARQIAIAAQRKATVVRLDQQLIDDPAAPLDPAVAAVAAHLTAGRHVALTTAGLAPSPLGQDAVVERLARIVCAPAVGGRIGGLVLTGGDVAAAVCRAVEAEALWLRGEVLPAIPWGVLAGGRLPGLPVVTKAGSFGAADALVRCLDHLAGIAERAAPG